jgi:hypothetical protein
MKPEDMTRDQLIAEVKRQWAVEAQLRLSNQQAWDRYEQANRMTKSYMNEFEARGLMYSPNKISCVKGDKE